MTSADPFILASREYVAWLKQYASTIKLLRLQSNAAWSNKARIESIDANLVTFRRRLRYFVVLSALVALMALLFDAFREGLDLSALTFLSAHLGVVGTALAVYGFSLGPSAPVAQEPGVFKHFTVYNVESLARAVGEILAMYQDAQWNHLAIELRKTLALRWGFVFLIASYLVQIPGYILGSPNP
jgi:hypothetical protein